MKGANEMAKVLKLTFTLDNNDTMDVSISAPKEGLDAAAVGTAAADLSPVLVSSAGASATGLKSAKYVTTSEEAIL